MNLVGRHCHGIHHPQQAQSYKSSLRIQVFRICIILNQFQDLFRSNSSISSRSSMPDIPKESRVINYESYQVCHVDLGLGDWNIPKVTTNQIYKSSQSIKSFSQDYNVKTVEQVYGPNREYETCYFFTSSTIKAHKKKGFNFLHIGLVQVGIKPLVRQGLNSSICMALRDIRHLNFDDSLLGVVQSNLSSGPVHFDCFPNFIVSLHDPHVLKAPTLNIKTFDTSMIEGTKQLVLIYKVYYKCIKTNLNVQALKRILMEKLPSSRLVPLDPR